MSCQTRIKEQNIPQLWDWLKQNDSQLFLEYQDQPEETCRKIRHQIRRINHLLDCEIIPGKDRHTLIVSPNNVHELFDDVRDIVSRAPQLKYWTITAFRPPRPLNDVENVKGIEYNIDDFRVAATKNPDGRVDLNIGVKNFDQYDYYKLLSAMFRILQKALGEYNVEFRLGKVVLNPLDDKIHTIKLKNLISVFQD